MHPPTTPRSARYRRAVFLLVDGARADVFRDLLDAGELPNVARYVAEPGGVVTATTVFPSVTGVAYAPYITGYFPETTNLTGVKWLDRESYAWRKLSLFRFRNYTGPGHFLMDFDLSRQCRTLFELLKPSSNIFGTISRGTGIRRNAYYFRRIPWALKYTFTGNWTPVDDRANQALLRAIDRHDERFTFHTTLQIDEHSHHDGPFSPRAREGYKAFDRVVGDLVARLRETGQLDETLLVLGADHGHSEVHEHYDLEAFFVRRGLRTLHYPKQFRAWFDCDVACMPGGNGMAHIYLRGAGWKQHEAGDERLARYPNIVADLLDAPAVDIVAWRPGDDGEVRVVSRRGAGNIRLDAESVAYRVDPGAGDPYGYDALPERMSRREALERTQGTDYPDGLVQLAQLFGAPRTGDLVVTARPGWDLRPTEHLIHRSGHGSLHRGHMAVPFGISHAFDTGAVRTVDAFTTILDLLGEPRPIGPRPLDGRSLLIPAA